MNKQNLRDYFTAETEDAIIAYNSTDDYIQKSIIYEKYIHYSFFKLTQNIIHTFKFYQTDVEDLEDLQHEIIIFLLGKIHMFHQSQSIQDRLNKIIIKEFLEEYNGDFCEYTGNSPKINQQQINSFIGKLEVSDECMSKLKELTPPKAFSYFGTMVKRWLILYTRKNYDNKLNYDDINNFKEEDNNDYIYNMEDEIYKEKEGDLSIFINEYVGFISNNIYKFFPKNNDAQIADAILELFRKRESIDIFNKKAIYLYIKEMVNEKTPKITKVTNKLHRIFKHNYDFYLENGYISFKY